MRRVCAIFAAFVASSALAVKGKGKGQGFMGKALKPFAIAAAPALVATGAHAAVPHQPISEMFAEHQGKLTSMLANEGTMRQAFHDFASKHGRDYVVQTSESHYADSNGKKSDEYSQVVPKPGQENMYEQRYLAFKDNVAMASKRNIDGQGQVVHSVTKFMDIPPMEFSKRNGLKLTDADRRHFSQIKKWEPKVEDSKAKFLGSTSKWGNSKNWADDGYTTDIKDQGQCGSCWAHSAVEQVESMAKIGGIEPAWGTMFRGSPQELVSCDKGDGDQGCNGGNPLTALQYLGSTPLEPESDYPYTSGRTERDGPCNLDKTEGKYLTINPVAVSEDASGESKMKKYVLNNGPLSIAVDANSAWQSYFGGILPASSCGTSLDHAVQAVGIDEDEGYWVVRNSWGADWGEMGMIRLPLDKNACGIALMASTTDVQSNDGAAKDVEMTDASASEGVVV